MPAVDNLQHDTSGASLDDEKPKIKSLTKKDQCDKFSIEIVMVLIWLWEDNGYIQLHPHWI